MRVKMAWRFTRRGVVAVALAGGVMAAAQQPGGDGEDPGLALVREAFQEQAGRWESVRFDWSMFTVINAESTDSPALAQYPDDPVTLTASGALIAADGNTRLEEVRDTWSPLEGEPVPRESVEVHNGDHARRYMPDRERGTIGGSHVAAEHPGPDILTHLLDPEGYILDQGDRRDIAYLGMETLEDGRDYVVIGDPAQVEAIAATGIATGEVAYYLDPELGYAMTRRVNFRADGEIGSVTDIGYAEHPETGLAPSYITNRRYDGRGQLVRDSQLVVDAVDVNFEVEPGTFELEFPEGITVYDFLREEEFVVAARDVPEDPAPVATAATPPEPAPAQEETPATPAPQPAAEAPAVEREAATLDPDPVGNRTPWAVGIAAFVGLVLILAYKLRPN